MKHTMFGNLMLSLFFLLSPLSAHAQDAGKAQEVLEKTAEAYTRGGGTKIVFRVSSNEGASEGTIQLKGKKFVLESEGVKTWFDGKTQWTYLADNDEVNVSEPKAEELQSINPYAWLDLYKDGYTLKMGNTSAFNQYQVIMTSTKRRQDMQCIILFVDKRTFQPTRLSLAGNAGKDVAIVSILSYQSHLDLDDAMFVFDPGAYPKAEVIDLR